MAHAGLTAADLRGGSAITDVVTIVPPATTTPPSQWDIESFDDPILYAKKRDIMQFEKAGFRKGIKTKDPDCRELWSDFIHEMKEIDPGSHNSRGDFSWRELENLTSQFCRFYPQCCGK